jgi:hypothetical protein
VKGLALCLTAALLQPGAADVVAFWRGRRIISGNDRGGRLVLRERPLQNAALATRPSWDIMATGRSTQLTGQIGEYLVAAQLCRHDLIAATFSGNVEHFDVLATDASGRAVAVQVKTIKTGDWQLNADRYLLIEQTGDRQVVRGLGPEPHPGLMCVFVRLGVTYAADEFYVLSWRDVQRLVAQNYRANLKRLGGVRPRNPSSRHTAVSTKHLEPFRDAWTAFLPDARARSPK